ncbi:MAG: cupin domain-containing protein [Alphaproteobacteria bacterium]|nr:cupin domain-containing protein [Alphaproteobacteria bacterium]
MKIFVLLTSPDSLSAKVLKADLPPLQYPSEVALNLTKTYKTFGDLIYLGCEQESKTTNYVFHLFCKDLRGRITSEARRLLCLFADKMPQKASLQNVTDSQIHLRNLIKVFPAALSDYPDKVALQNGRGFFNKDIPYPNGVLNFPERINFLGMNIYQKNIPRGNHWHYHKVEYTYVLQGKIRVDFYLINHPEEKFSITLTAGDMALFLPGSFHSVCALTETAYAVEASPQLYEAEDYYYSKEANS